MGGALLALLVVEAAMVITPSFVPALWPGLIPMRTGLRVPVYYLSMYRIYVLVFHVACYLSRVFGYFFRRGSAGLRRLVRAPRDRRSVPTAKCDIAAHGFGLP